MMNDVGLLETTQRGLVPAEQSDVSAFDCD